MDHCGDKQVCGNDQNCSPIRMCETESETRKTCLPESGCIQEVENLFRAPEEVDAVYSRETINIFNSDAAKCNLDRNDKCDNNNSVDCSRALSDKYSHCELLNNETDHRSKTDSCVLKKCSVVLNRCDENTRKSAAMPKSAFHVIPHPLADYVESQNSRQVLTYFKQNFVDSEFLMKTGPENNDKCLNMDIDEEFSGAECVQDSSCEAVTFSCPKTSSRTNGVKSEEYELDDTEETGKGRKTKNKTCRSDMRAMETFAVPKKTSDQVLSQKVVARRSSRHLRKQTNYEESSEDPEITEIIPTDPLLPDPLPTRRLNDVKKTGKAGTAKNNTIVVNNTEQLFQIASGKGIKRKKEPTLVIIDTNSILSGKGPVPVSQLSLAGPLTQSSIITGYSVLPSIGGSWSIHSSVSSTQPSLQGLNNFNSSAIDKSQFSSPQIAPLIESAVYFIDAPSFIVPYLYQQSPKKSLKKYIEQLQGEIEVHSCTSEHSCINNINSQNTVNNKLEQNSNQRDNKKKCDEFEESTDLESNSQHMKNMCVKSNSIIKCEISTNNMDDKTDESSSKCDGSAHTHNSTCTPSASNKETVKEHKKSDKSDQDYFISPLGSFFMQIGLSLVKEYVLTNLGSNYNKNHTDLLESNLPFQIPANKLEYIVEDNKPFHFEQKKCVYCKFQTESSLVMAHHLETPHMFNNVYRCNFCNLIIENRSKIVYHMLMSHDMRVLLECAPAQHQCPNCSFEDNNKSKVNCHMVSCSRKHKPDRNQEPPSNWEPPAKIMHHVHKPPSKRSKTASSYQMSSKGVRYLLPKLPPSTVINANFLSGQQDIVASKNQTGVNQNYRSKSKQIPITTIWQRPNVSITPVPKLQTFTAPADIATKHSLQGNSVSLLNSAQKLNHACEICDARFIIFGDLQIHLQDHHQVKFSKKATYSTPSLGCQKCPLRFFTDQGLERHLLGTHGLVTASIQEAARNETDGGHCPICTKSFQRKLLQHMNKVHKMSLKPVNISYKCTLCSTVTFDRYKQFEDHVFAMHSLSKRKNSVAPPVPHSKDVLKSLKINNEITIISHCKQSHASTRSKSTDVIPLDEKNGNSQSTSIQEVESKCNVDDLEEKDSLLKEKVMNISTSGEEKIDSTCAMDKNTDKCTTTEQQCSSCDKRHENNSSGDKNCGDCVLSTDKTEHYSPNDKITDNLSSEKTTHENCLSNDKRYENPLINDNKSKVSCDAIACSFLAPLHHNCTHLNNEKCSEQIQKTENSSLSERNRCEPKQNDKFINNNDMHNNTLKNVVNEENAEKNDQESTSQTEVSVSEIEISDTVSVQHQHDNTKPFSQQKKKNSNTEQHLCVELIHLDDSPVKEKHLEDKCTKISVIENSDNCSLMINQDQNFKNKTGENYSPEGRQRVSSVEEINKVKTEDKALKYNNENFENKTELVNADSLEQSSLSTSQFKKGKVTSKYFKTKQQQDNNIEVIQLDDSITEHNTEECL